jgi:hypothetical protein
MPLGKTRVRSRQELKHLQTAATSPGSPAFPYLVRPPLVRECDPHLAIPAAGDQHAPLEQAPDVVCEPLALEPRHHDLRVDAGSGAALPRVEEDE